MYSVNLVKVIASYFGRKPGREAIYSISTSASQTIYLEEPAADQLSKFLKICKAPCCQQIVGQNYDMGSLICLDMHFVLSFSVMGRMTDVGQAG